VVFPEFSRIRFDGIIAAALRLHPQFKLMHAAFRRQDSVGQREAIVVKGHPFVLVLPRDLIREIKEIAVQFEAVLLCLQMVGSETKKEADQS